MDDARVAARLALILGVTACSLAAWAWVRASTPAVCPCDETAWRREVGSVSQRVATLERAPRAVTLPASEAPPRLAFGDTGEPPESGPPGSAEPPRPPPAVDPVLPVTPRYVAFRAIPAGVTVTPQAGDAVSVENTDPALTGRVLRVEAETADGRVEAISIVVPAPAPARPD